MRSCCAVVCSVPRFRQRFELVCPEFGDMHSILDVAKVADCLLLVVTQPENIDGYAERTLTCLLKQGLPAPILCLQVW